MEEKGIAMSTSTPVSGMDTGILLEAGTNEVEVLVFTVGESRFGVNVAKVREVLEVGKVTAIPESHPSVEGMIRVRDHVVLTINLTKFLYGDGEISRPRATDRMLLLEFNQQTLAFRVQSVRRIYRVSWSETKTVPDAAGSDVPISGIILLDGEMVQMLDFETIGSMLGLYARESHETDAELARAMNASDVPIVFAEDSRAVYAMIRDELLEDGFADVKGFPDGQTAWDHLAKLAEGETPDTIRSKVGALITDIEMPGMDGFNLTRRVRQHPVLKDVPIIIFSSLVSKDNKKKGLQVGANAQVAKPHYDELTKQLQMILCNQVA